MRIRFSTFLPVCVVLTALVVTAYSQKKPGELDRLKSLLGTWNGKDAQGNSLSASFRLVADERSVMETFSREEGNESTVTMFYDDDGTLMLSHYGVRGNQPRMRLDHLKSTDNSLVFTLLDMTDLKSDKDAQLREITFRLAEGVHLTQTWDFLKEGSDSKESVVLERVSEQNTAGAFERLKTLVGSWKGKDTKKIPSR
ncbi:MAG TPA: hypothetical protein VL126_08680 [Bacteroidota bacterium]|nr:hypothetical protein [Bacteroidota bacterium]